MASAADLNLVSASSSSSDFVSRRCIASRAPRCSMRICRCLAIGGQSTLGTDGADPGRVLGMAVQGLAGGPLSEGLRAARLAGGLRAPFPDRGGQLDLLSAASALRGRALGGADSAGYLLHG